MSDGVAQDQIRAFVERIMRMREEAKAINADIREIYAEAKANGFDKTVLGKVVLYVEKRSTKAAELLEAEAVFDLYLAAFDGATGTRIATHTHEAESEAGRTRSESASEAASDEASQHSIGESREGVQSPASAGDKPAAPPSGEPAETAASNPRAMTMTPLEPREAGGLKGFGFTVKFEDAKPLRPFCLRPHSGCGGQGKSHCHSCRVAAQSAGKEAA